LRIVFPVTRPESRCSNAGNVDGLFLAWNVNTLGSNDDGVTTENATDNGALEGRDERSCGCGSVSRGCSAVGRRMACIGRS